MRHGARTQSFSRPFNQRKWLMRNLAVSLVEHERITTTLAKAKELRRVVEKAVTLGKRGSLADRRLLLSRFPNPEMVKKVFSDLAPRFSTRPGGYTRIFRLSRRPGDNAEMAIIEFIDAKVKSQEPVAPKKAKSKTKGDDATAKAKSEKATAKKAARAEKAEAKKASGSKAASSSSAASKSKKTSKSK